MPVELEGRRRWLWPPLRMRPDTIILRQGTSHVSMTQSDPKMVSIQGNCQQKLLHMFSMHVANPPRRHDTKKLPFTKSDSLRKQPQSGMLIYSKCRNGAPLAWKSLGKIIVPPQRAVPVTLFPGSVKFKSSHVIKSGLQKGSRFTGPKLDDGKKGPSQPKNPTTGAHEFSSGWHRASPHFAERLYENSIHPDICLDPVRPFPDSDLASTRPAPLDSPEEPSPGPDGSVPIQERASYLFRLGKAYLAFYKTGLKNTWSNYKQSVEIRGRLNCSLSKAAMYGGQPEARDLKTKVPQISRKEYQLVLRSRHDIQKLIPFALIFAICGEFTPLVIVLLGSSVVPYTCRIPKQVAYDHERPFRVSNSMLSAGREHSKQFDLYETGQEMDNSYYGGTPEHEFTWQRYWLKAYLLGVNPFPKPIPIIGSLWWKYWILPRLVHRGNEILGDMILIRREGGYARLEPIEVFECAYRYFNVDCMRELIRRKDAGVGYNPSSRDLKDILVPLLEAHADQVLGYDYSRLHPKARWQAVMAT
jgi:hypothetical protein